MPKSISFKVPSDSGKLPKKPIESSPKPQKIRPNDLHWRNVGELESIREKALSALESKTDETEKAELQTLIEAIDRTIREKRQMISETLRSIDPNKTPKKNNEK